MAVPAKENVLRPVGLRDVAWVLFAPARLAARIEDVPAWRWPLVVLLALVTLIGYAMVETGLIDRQVDLDVRARIAAIDTAQRDVIQRSELRELYDREYKAGEFWKVLTRVRVVAAEPARLLANVLVIAAVLYGAVALTGRKAEWHTLLTICVFASFVEALRMLAELGLMLSFQTLDVHTSAAPLLAMIVPAAPTVPAQAAGLAAGQGLLTVLDPFRIWFWVFVIVATRVTRQLPGWRAWVVCALCWLAGGVGRAAAAVAMVPGLMGGGQGGM